MASQRRSAEVITAFLSPFAVEDRSWKIHVAVQHHWYICWPRPAKEVNGTAELELCVVGNKVQISSFVAQLDMLNDGISRRWYNVFTDSGKVKPAKDIDLFEFVHICFTSPYLDDLLAQVIYSTSVTLDKSFSIIGKKKRDPDATLEWVWETWENALEKSNRMGQMLCRYVATSNNIFSTDLKFCIAGDKGIMCKVSLHDGFISNPHNKAVGHQPAVAGLRTSGFGNTVHRAAHRDRAGGRELVCLSCIIKFAVNMFM